ncbi:hypothetical protein BGW39_000385 [Mortierella sp. 14UC]|nr:hypothetical protein BGW39_000385 [Mortierella sp. 14UC]
MDTDNNTKDNDNFIPTGWVKLTITRKTSQIADDGTLQLAIAGQRGGHAIDLLPQNIASPWGSDADDLYSNVQLPCQVEVKGRLLIGIADDDDEEQRLAGMAIIIEEWRAVKAPSTDSLFSSSNDSTAEQEQDEKETKDDKQSNTAGKKRKSYYTPKESFRSASSNPCCPKCSRSLLPSTSNQQQVASPPPSLPSTPPSRPQRRQLPTISVFQPAESNLPSFLPHTIRPRPSRLRVTDAYFFDGRGYCRPPQEGSGLAYPREFDGLFVFDQQFSDGQRRVIRIAANAHAEESVDSLVIYEDWR